MTFDVPESLARNFLAAASETAEELISANAAAARAQRDRVRAKLGRIVGDYEREMEPLVQAIARLPELNGMRITVKDVDFRTSSVSMNVQIICNKPNWESKFTVDALTKIDGQDSFSLTLDPVPDQARGKECASFADVAKMLAYWFGRVAPERLPELAAIMMPETSVALNRDMKASSVLKLKTPQQ